MALLYYLQGSNRLYTVSSMNAKEEEDDGAMQNRYARAQMSNILLLSSPKLVRKSPCMC